MMRHLAVVVPIAIVVLSAQMAFAQPQKPMTPTAPGSAGDPIWQGTLRMSDGRTFVTDGGLAIDSAIARLSKVPDRQLPSKVLEEYLKAPQKDACRLDDLTGIAPGKTYKTPSGIALNSTYINYLRRTLPARSVRLRMTAPARPVLVEVDGKLVGVLMPVAQ
jgi:hypothetical protein